ncbi:Hypothetical protein Minf_0814 [Methylacidiphilum infernorum V4]|uniref:Uncharacterized protein n=1 Tax=Methylacidiphilum infernorum (isolate V4) TaxID=481448 RepID=B3E173_METI4|nr:Hypothetical protein Minf_0814 [Methylacidiphilum infernorum V4]
MAFPRSYSLAFLQAFWPEAIGTSPMKAILAT